MKKREIFTDKGLMAMCKSGWVAAIIAWCIGIAVALWETKHFPLKMVAYFNYFTGCFAVWFLSYKFFLSQKSKEAKG